MSDAAFYEECKYLIRLAERLSASIEDADTRLVSWRESAAALLQSPDIESPAMEPELERLSLQLRSEWLRYANSLSSLYLKSPPSFQKPLTPSGDVALTPYDRWLEPVALESRAAAYRPPPAGWHGEHVMFNTGMGAMTCLLMIMRTMFQPTAARPLQLHGLGGYFEIMDIIRANNDEVFRTAIVTEQQQLMQSVAAGASHLVYIEPVTCQFGLEVFDLEEFLRAWKQRPANVPSILIFDTTLSANLFPIDELVRRAQPHKPPVVIQFSSTLKLDQEGLEFSNGGLMSVYSENRQSAADIAFRLRRFRSAMGLGLSMDQIYALDYPGFLDRQITDRHAAAVFANNAYVAERFETGDDLLFAAGSHPVLNGAPPYPWAVAPFVYLRLRKGSDKEDLQMLKYVMAEEAESRGLTFLPGSSFGFRGHRCELGGIRDVDGYETIRVAMGARSGPGLDAAVDLMNELSRLGTFARVRERYPRLVEVARKAAELKKQHARPH